MKKIKVVTERYCCQYNDLEPLEGYGQHGYGRNAPWLRMKCKHCGQMQEYYRYMDAAGSMDWDYRPIKKETE